MLEAVALFIHACSVLILPVRKMVRKLITRLRITAYPGQALFKASTVFSCSAVVCGRSLPSNAAATKGEICRHINKEWVAGTGGATFAGGIVVAEVTGVVGVVRQRARNLAR